MLKCRISLDAFAWELEETVVESAKDLFSEAKLSDLDNIGQGVWTALVAAGSEQYEIELLVKSRIFKKVGCECTEYAAGQICNHIVTGFFAVLERLPKKALRNDPILAIPLAKRKIRDFIEMLPEARMDEVISNFARKNRKFALVVRAAATPYAVNEPDKYKDILFLAIKQATPNRKLSASGLNFINEIAFAIMTELKSMLNQGDTEEVRLFTDEFLRVWPSIKNYDLPDTKRSLLALNQALGLLQDSMSIIIAPDLIEKVVIRLADHVPIYARVEPVFADKIIRLVHKWAKNSSIQEQCAELILPFLAHELTFAEMQPVLNLLVGWGRPAKDLLVPVFKYWDEESCLNYCQLAIDGGHFELLALLVKEVKSNKSIKNIETTLADFEIVIAKSLGNTTQLINLAEKNFKETGKVKYYKILKDCYKKNWLKEAKRLHAFFVGMDKPLPAAMMLIDLKDWDALVELTKQQEDLLLLSQIDKPLFVHRPEETKELYTDLLVKYFDAHLGNRPVDTYVFLLKHLEEIGHRDFAKSISQWMVKRYGHRPLLKSVF